MDLHPANAPLANILTFFIIPCASLLAPLAHSNQKDSVFLAHLAAFNVLP